ncbi:Component of oligomeric Golgi complex 6 [Seminavis robusta]|uniref:Component of oligomeric Golgi complex 6 n=1 Tax=Seminavis robusta TaxID=568900 RepID=A0A9N8HTP2_9STRA|nr:Component of oligomeric Golgi complex 6 [Seminavis robusta]|eukprot:Sro1297_g260470.1 Component of oligomeric Golgi complex 6 (233) ;mRNA; f:13735-14433
MTTLCNTLDLSWLNESIVEAALDNQRLSLSDAGHLDDSLRAAKEYGSMDADVSERLHHRIEERKECLLEKMVVHETRRVTKQLGLYGLLKSHQKWGQVLCMADMQGQGSCFTMVDFKGLATDQVAQAMSVFHTYLQENPGKLPYTPPGDAKSVHVPVEEGARPLVETKVAEKVCRAYTRLYKSLVDPDLGGYKKDFLDQTVLYNPDQLFAMLGVSRRSSADSHEGIGYDCTS